MTPCAFYRHSTAKCHLPRHSDFGHYFIQYVLTYNSKFKFIFPSLGAHIFHLNTIEPSEIFKLTFKLAVSAAARPFLFMIDISLDFGEVLKQAAEVSDLWL